MPASIAVTRATKILRVLLALVACVLWRGDLAAASMPTESEVKAVFLYNFAKFTEWPASSFEQTGGALVLGVHGPDPFGAILERLAAAQQVQGRRIVIRRGRTLAELGFCHVLFLAGRAGEPAAESSIRAVSGAGQLIVGDGQAFAENGGGIGFYLDDRKVRFVINLAATDRAGLKLSSKLLKIATVIRK
jgi:hypothetical protein